MCIAKKLGERKDLALFIVRVVVGIIFLAHGVGKLQAGVPGFAGMLGNLGFPAPLFFAWVVALTETLGGIGLILGVFSRLAALLIAIVMIVAIIKVKAAMGLVGGAELDLGLLVGLLAVLLQGPGAWSVEWKLFKRELC